MSSKERDDFQLKRIEDKGQQRKKKFKTIKWKLFSDCQQLS